MRLSHQSLEKYLKNNESKFLGKSFYSPVLLCKDTLLFFSADKSKEFLCFDLSTKNSCFYIHKTNQFFESINNVFCSQLRGLSNEFMIVDYGLEKNDFVLTFRVAISNDSNKDLFFNFEIFPNHPNLIVTDIHGKIILSFYHSKNGLPENGSKYVKNKIDKLVDGEQVLDEKYIEFLFEKSIKQRRLDKYENFINDLNGKIKKCHTKISNIEKDKIAAENNIKYQQFADNLLSSSVNLKQKLPSIIIRENQIKLDPSKTIIDNVQTFYKKAKKGKKTLELVQSNLDRAKQEIESYQKILNELYNSNSEKEADKIVSLYSFSKKREVSKTIFNSPWKINYQGVYFYFGKNSSQNDYLSFVIKQNRNFIWLHIKNQPGSHIVIASEKPTDDQLLFACELSLFLSKQKAGEVQYTKKKNIRRGHVLGEAIIKNYSTIKLNYIRERSIQIFETAKRCD